MSCLNLHKVPFSKNILLFKYLLIFIYFFSLYFSEIRSIRFSYYGERSISYFDVLTLGMVLMFIANYTWFLKSNIRYIFFNIYAPIIIPIVIIVLFYASCDVCDTSYPIRLYSLSGQFAFMLALSVGLSIFSEEGIVKFIYYYALLIFAINIIQLVMINTELLYIFNLYYADYSAFLHWPFPNPNHSGIYSVVLFLLLSAVVIIKDKLTYLYFLIPIMSLIILQTGSRALAFVSLAAWLGFVLLFAFSNNKISRLNVFFHFLAVSLISIAIIMSISNYPTNRALGIFDYNLTSILAGDVDNDIRKEWWGSNMKRRSNVPSQISGGADSKNITLDEKVKNTIFNYDLASILSGDADIRKKWLIKHMASSRSIEVLNESETVLPLEKAEILPAGIHYKSLHNVYLDFKVYGGAVPYYAFLLFIFILSLQFFILVYKKRKSRYYPLYFASFISMIVIFSMFYAHPLFGVRYIWVFLGFIISLLVINSRKAVIE